MVGRHVRTIDRNDGMFMTFVVGSTPSIKLDGMGAAWFGMERQ